MNGSDFLSMFDGKGPEGGAGNTAKDELRDSLENDSRRHYVDVSGDGTHYVCCGIRNGVGFSRCDITLDDGGLVTVRANSVNVPDKYARDVSRLARNWNQHFIVEGFTVEDGRLEFVTAPFNPLTFGIDCAEVVGKALSTVHHFAGVVLALDAGVEPWNLVDLFDDDDGGSRGGGGGGGGRSVRPDRDDDADPFSSLMHMLHQS